MDVDLMRFLKHKVCFRNDPNKIEYRVAGINWDTSQILVMCPPGMQWIYLDILDIVFEDDEERD